MYNIPGRTIVLPLLVLVSGLFSHPAWPAAEQNDPQASEIWSKVRQSLFEARPIETSADAVIQLDAPVRAEDAAIVPISIKVQAPQTADKFIRKIYLIIDHNPSPIAAIFTLFPDSGRADLETRVRIDEYTHVRAIAETSDGKLYMATHYMKASGGCSAPAGKDAQAALANLGKIRLRVDPDVRMDKPNIVQLMISHPNNSGFAMDQVTRLFVPSHYVRQISVTYAGKPVLSADVDFSISENPNFRFYFVPHGPGTLQAEVMDSSDLNFKSAIDVKPGPTPES